MTAITTSTPIPAGTTWTVDKVHSTVGFAVKHMVVSTFRGRFEDYDATLTAAEDGTLRLEGRVSADSIVVKDENLAAHLKAPDFFDTERHPYDHLLLDAGARRGRRADRRRRADDQGQHAARSRPAARSPSRTSTFGDVEKVGLELEAIVDRTEYGLNWNAPLPKGGFALANEVKLLGRPRAGAAGVVDAGSRPLRQPARRLPQLQAPPGGRRPAARRRPSSSSSTGSRRSRRSTRTTSTPGPTRSRRCATRSPPPTRSWSPPRSTTTRSRASSRTPSTGSRARWPNRRCATSRPRSSAPRTGLFGAVWAQAEARKVLSAIGARVIDRELPVGMADDAFDADGTLADEDHSLALAGILAELAGETRPRRRSKGDSPL